jgi:hypothetical protein
MQPHNVMGKREQTQGRENARIMPRFYLKNLQQNIFYISSWLSAILRTMRLRD